MPKDLKEEMKKIRKKVWDKNKKKYKDFGTFGEDEFLKQDRLPGMKYGGTVMPKDKPKETQKPKNFYEGEGYKGSPDMYPDYEEDKKDIKQGKKPQHMGMKEGGFFKPVDRQAELEKKAKEYKERKQKTVDDYKKKKEKQKDRALEYKYQKEKDVQELIARRRTATEGSFKKGGLAGKQKKLDVNKDGKISGEDFEILRGKTNKMKGGGCAIRGTNFKGVY